jgi:hypothetical protein
MHRQISPSASTHNGQQPGICTGTLVYISTLGVSHCADFGGCRPLSHFLLINYRMIPPSFIIIPYPPKKNNVFTCSPQPARPIAFLPPSPKHALTPWGKQQGRQPRLSAPSRGLIPVCGAIAPRQTASFFSHLCLQGALVLYRSCGGPYWASS